MIDLDQLGHLADVAAAASAPGGLTASLAKRTHDLIRELRAAREVVEAAGPVILNPHNLDYARRLHKARNAYDEAAAA